MHKITTSLPVRIVCYDRAQEYRNGKPSGFFFGTMCDFGFALFLDLWFWKMIYAGGVLLHVERFF